MRIDAAEFEEAVFSLAPTERMILKSEPYAKKLAAVKKCL